MSGLDSRRVDVAGTWIAVAVVCLACLGGAVVLAEWPLSGVAPDAPEEPRSQFVEPTDGGTRLWPYTSRVRGYEGRTLGINVIFYGSPEEVRAALTERPGRDWVDDPDGGEADAETVSTERIEIDPGADGIEEMVAWNEARGATRYTYFETDDGGVWTDESYQLHAGTYLGKRSHIRAYDEPTGEWTAVQIHEEHWDWFRLRHTVTGISEPRRDLEGAFMDDRTDRTVVRLPFGNETADGDGWASGIYLAGAAVPALLFGLGRRSRTPFGDLLRSVDRREFALAVGLFGLYTAVRWLGVGAETLLSMPPKVAAAPLYAALVVGAPAIAYRFGRSADGTGAWAFALAVLGLGAAIVVDFAAMGVAVLPLRIVLHRAAVLLAVGLIAVGGSTSRERPVWNPLAFGLASWALVLSASLFGSV